MLLGLSLKCVKKQMSSFPLYWWTFSWVFCTPPVVLLTRQGRECVTMPRAGVWTDSCSQLFPPSLSLCLSISVSLPLSLMLLHLMVPSFLGRTPESELRDSSWSWILPPQILHPGFSASAWAFGGPCLTQKQLLLPSPVWNCQEQPITTHM